MTSIVLMMMMMLHCTAIAFWSLAYFMYFIYLIYLRSNWICVLRSNVEVFFSTTILNTYMCITIKYIIKHECFIKNYITIWKLIRYIAMQIQEILVNSQPYKKQFSKIVRFYLSLFVYLIKPFMSNVSTHYTHRPKHRLFSFIHFQIHSIFLFTLQIHDWIAQMAGLSRKIW